MALVNIVNMSVLDNPTCFLNPFQFEITFECLQELDDDLEWKVLYVGSAHDAQYDQILDEILVGPIPVGLNKFILQADAPNIDLLLQQPNISSDDILGVTVVLVTCSYKEREFVRIGYYVNNEYLGYENMNIDNNATSGTNIDNDDENELDTNKATTQSPSQPQQSVDGTIVTPSSTTTTEQQGETPPLPPPTVPKISIYDIDFQKVQRQILADKPRVTKFPIPWNISDTTTTTTNDSNTATTTTSFTNNVQQQQDNVENNNNNNTTFSHVASSLSSPSTATTTTSFMNHHNPDKSSAVATSSFQQQQQQQHTTFTN